MGASLQADTLFYILIQPPTGLSAQPLLFSGLPKRKAAPRSASCAPVLLSFGAIRMLAQKKRHTGGAALDRVKLKSCGRIRG